jgi:stage II sporulation protein D
MLSRSLFAACLLIVAHAQAQERTMRIGLLRDRTVRNAVVMSSKGNSTVYADGERKGEIQTNDGLKIEAVKGGLAARSLNLSFTAKTRIEVVPRLADGGFRLRSLDHKLGERIYPGSLVVENTVGTLLLIDVLPVEPYIAGVVKAEAGNDHHPEYYKLQSVSCRTYALSNARKHLPEGFELCDGVHCQVFHGVNRQPEIQKAVEATHGLVLVDADIRLIHATFHSNCGGETVNAEDLWSKSEPYLRATMDTFCLRAPHATWQKTLTRTEWLAYLGKRFSFRATDEAQLKAVLDYTPTCRDLYLGNTWPLIPLKHVREDLHLRSTYFSVHSQADQVVLEGRGFGHGVGLCQEGAMRMAKSAHPYTDILHHYYTDVHLVDLSTLDFFREEAPVPDLAGPRPR